MENKRIMRIKIKKKKNPKIKPFQNNTPNEVYIEEVMKLLIERGF